MSTLSKKNLNKKIYFRVDASSKIGLGHLIRSLAIANMTKDSFNCHFLIRKPEESILKFLQNSGFDFTLLDPNIKYSIEARNINSRIDKNQIVVFDGYYFNESYFKTFKDSGHKTLLIDDFGKLFHNIDVILNHSLSCKEEDYNRGIYNFELGLGSKYALLRPPFLEKAKEIKHIDFIKKAFVCFGGADTYNLTLKVLKALNLVETPLEIFVVLAGTHPLKKEIKEYLNKINHKFEVHENLLAEDMAKIMGGCDIAYAPTSGIAYEICACKIAFIGGYYIDNQKQIHDGFKKEGCLYSIGDLTKVSERDIVEATNYLIKNKDKAKEIVKNQSRIIDGNSDKHLTLIFEKL